MTSSIDGSSDPESWFPSYSLDCFCSFAPRIRGGDKGERRVGAKNPQFPVRDVRSPGRHSGLVG